MSGVDEYEIRQIADLLNVPVAARPAMLADLAEWLALQDHLRAQFDDLIAQGYVRLPPVFRWIDDGVAGLRNLTITVREATP